MEARSNLPAPSTRSAASILPKNSTWASTRRSPVPKSAKSSTGSSRLASSISSSSTSATVAALRKILHGVRFWTTSQPLPRLDSPQPRRKRSMFPTSINLASRSIRIRSSRASRMGSLRPIRSSRFTSMWMSKAMRITGSDTEGQAQLGNFIDPESKYPVLVTTSRLLSTGVDVQTCRLIVLDRAVGSMTEFKQIVGRGTRSMRIRASSTSLSSISGALRCISPIPISMASLCRFMNQGRTIL